MKLAAVRTPQVLKFEDEDRRTIHDIGSCLTKEMNQNSGWTEECSALMTNNPKMLFLYDRFEHSLGNAYGNSSYKIALNPMMVMCYHPDCLKRSRGPAVKLKHPFFLQTYISHLLDHLDEIGEALQIRFSAVNENCFITPASLDKLRLSPYLMQTNIVLNSKAVEIIESYGINRKLSSNYICHWKDQFIRQGIINSESLSFQEDEALVNCILNYPNPIKDHSKWSTVYLYGLKFLSSVSATGLNLYRGVTHYPGLSDHAVLANVEEFASTINHVSASLTSYQRLLPDLNYNNESFHGREILYHIKCLEKSEDSFRLHYTTGNVFRFPVTIGVDEQELNPGTFIHNNMLHGLEKKMNAEEIKTVGLNDLSAHIAEKNNFIKAVRESRAIDFRDKVCSNIHTEFLSHDLTGDECLVRFQKCMKYANSCRMCLLDQVECKYKKINERCENCVEQNTQCISLIALHLLWDMGSGHKKADIDYNHLDIYSSEGEMFSTEMVTIAFGGLHLCKSFVCSARNYVLAHDGEHFGVNILHEIKQKCEILQTVNNSVFVGRDKQSDLLNYTLIGEKVQLSLKSNKEYLITRVPEKYLSYKENAKTQKRIVMPTAVATNRNGDVFLVDSGAFCVHIVDNSSVAKVYTLGTYGKHSLIPYDGSMNNVAKMMKFGDQLAQIYVDDISDNVIIFDTSRAEVSIIKECSTAKNVLNKRFYVLKVAGALSVVYKSDLFVLECKEDGYYLKKIRFQLPKKSVSTGSCFNFEHYVMAEISLPGVSNVQSIFYLPYENMVGCFTTDNTMSVINLRQKSMKSIDPINVESNLNPFVSSNGQLLCWSFGKLSVFQLSDEKKGISIKLIKSIELEGNVHAICIRGNVVSIVTRYLDQFVLMEWGTLKFGLRYCEALWKLYRAINYSPPRAGQFNYMKLEESIEAAQDCCDLLRDMQQEREKLYSSRSSFIGSDGTPWSATISCLQRTVASWKILNARLEILQPGSSSKIMSHSVANESRVEHSFGFTKKKGQGNNENMQEYVASKRTHMVDFQMRMCKLPFCQYTKTKLRDKGYQSLENRQVPMSLTEFKEIFSYRDKFGLEENPVASVSDDCQQILKKAQLMSKYVPRQSSRSKWRAQSGQIPTMVADNSRSGSLYKDDLVFYRDIAGNVTKLVVMKDYLLVDKSIPLEACAIGEKETINVMVENLILDGQQIFTVPSTLYHVQNGCVTFSNIVQPLFENIAGTSSNNGTTENTDEDWAILIHEDHSDQGTTSNFENNNEIPEVIVSNVKDSRTNTALNETNNIQQPETDEDEAVLKKKRRLLKHKVSDGNDDESISFFTHKASIGDWVVVDYLNVPFVGQVNDVNVIHGYKVATLENSGTNCFKWSSIEPIWYKNILLVVDAPCPANNRGAVKFPEEHYEKFRKLTGLT